MKHIPESRQVQFEVPLQSIVNTRQAIIDMVMPFYRTGDIENRDLCHSIRFRYHHGAKTTAARQKSNDELVCGT